MRLTSLTVGVSGVNQWMKLDAGGVGTGYCDDKQFHKGRKEMTGPGFESQGLSNRNILEKSVPSSHFCVSVPGHCGLAAGLNENTEKQ